MPDLLVSVHTPVLRSGRATRTYGIARALATAGNGLAFLYVRFGAEDPDAAFRSIPGIELHAVVPSRGLRRLRAYSAARLRGVPDGFARGVSPELLEATRELAAASSGRVIADGPVEAATLAPLSGRVELIYNAHNLESAFRHELTRTRLGSPRTLRSFELSVLGSVTESWMVSELDADVARELCPSARIRVVPNVVDVQSIVPVAPATGARRAVFVGSFTYQPNRNALRFLLDEVFPRVWRELPDARLRIVGTGLDEPASPDPRVETVGFVPEIRSAYVGASCAVVPLLQGGGTPLKFIEALAYGLPVVATPLAAAGLAVHDRQHCLLAADVDAFASSLVRVLRDGAPELGRRGRALAAERYSVQALAALVRAGP